MGAETNHYLADPNYVALSASVRENPFSMTERGIMADWCDEHDLSRHAELLRGGSIPLTIFEELAVSVLGGCNFAPATWDKKFAQSLVAKMNEQRERKDVAYLTVKQWLWLWIMLRRYRRSVSHDKVKAEAEARYNRCLELLDLKHLKPIERRRRKATDDRPCFLEWTE